MAWLQPSDLFRSVEERRDEQSETQRLRRMAAIRSRARSGQQPLVAAVPDWSPPVPVTWTRTKIGGHICGFYVWANAHSEARGRLLWYSACSCGWHCTRGFQLRTSVEASWRRHAEEDR